MARPESSVLEVRVAVRRFLDQARANQLMQDAVAVACSGGADSLALAAATVHYGLKNGIAVHGLVVDHQLQEGSAAVAARASQQLRDLGCTTTKILPVTVLGPGGIEAAARRVRYAALQSACPSGALVLLGHTMNDQAETVLLGLGRGSGPRSIAGMSALDPPWGRPLLGLTRATTEAACVALGLLPWHDPHNEEPRFTRVRLRKEVLPLLENVLQGGVVAALARTATQLQEDLCALDALAEDLFKQAFIEPPNLAVHMLKSATSAVRRRALRSWLLAVGASELTDAHLRSVDALIGAWHGQGGVALPGGLVVKRTHDKLHVARSR